MKAEIEETDRLINSRLKIQTIEKFDEILNEMSKLEFVSPENASEFIIKQSEQLNGGMIRNPKLFLDAQKYLYYYHKLCNFTIKEEQLEEMIKKLVIAEINAKEQDKFTKIKIRIIETVLSSFEIKTTEHFYQFVDKVIDLEQGEKTTEKTQEQNDNLLDNENKEALEDNFNTRKINYYESVLKNFKIKTIAQFDEILDKMIQLGFKTIQEAKNKEKTDKKAKKFCFYYGSLCSFINKRVIKRPEGDKIFNELDNDAEDFHHKIDKYILEQDALEGNLDYFLVSTHIVMMCNGPSVRRFLLNEMKQLIVLNDNICLEYIRCYITIFNTVSNVQVFLLLFSNAERFNFFLQWHKILEENLPNEDKQLFRDHLDSCREKLQNKKDYYNWFIENNFSWFTRREKQLTAIVIFGIIASAVVLTIYFLEMYAATWFFWFGIVGVVLTVAVGIRLFFCLKENWNDLEELASDLQKEGKTIRNKIDEIDRAIDVYDLDKIKHFKEPELKKISTFEANKNKIILNNNEINTTEQDNNSIQLESINTEKEHK